MKIWQCKIGESVSVPNGADAPMREAVARAYKELTGEEPTFIFSGWGAELTEPERAVVEDRLPAQPAASAEPSESAVLLDALSGLVNVLRKRHYGRMPDEVQAAYDKAWAIVFSSPIAAPAPVSQEPVAYLACDPETGEPVWGEDCVCKDNVYSPEDTGTIGRPVVFAPVAVRPIDMILRCPTCGTQHIDASDGDWTNPPHRSHLCATCGHIWRPADVATNGVAAIKTKGQNDSAPVAAQPVVTDEMVTRFLGWYLPRDFTQDAEVSSTPPRGPHSWHIGAATFIDLQARAMLEYVLTGVQK